MWGEGRLGLRKLAALAGNLPPGCALHRAEDPEGAGSGWGHSEELLASLIEVLDRHDRHFILAHSKRGAAKPKALKVPRPRDLLRRLRKKRPATGEELAGMMGAMGGAKLGDSKGVKRGSKRRRRVR